MVEYRTPGVYRQDVLPPPEPSLLTGVPVFLGYADRGPLDAPRRLSLWPQFQAEFGPPRGDGYLAYAVRGFFENDGLLCYVQRLDDDAAPVGALRKGLAAVSDLDAVDLVCAPDTARPADLTGPADLSDERYLAAATALQAEVLDDCRRVGGRFAILDGLLTSDPTVVEEQAALTSDDGALYYPWLWAPGEDGQPVYLPPCGHVAGVYSRSDQRVGVHKAAANEPIEGVLDLRVHLGEQALGDLYARRVNCLRAVPGRGIRVWGARTLSDDPAWRHISARRVFLTMGRWVERFMADVVHEPNDVRLWVRIMRELTAYLDDLFERGALKGRTPDEAFFVKCDSETNPPEIRDTGRVVTQVGLALAAPAEFVLARIIHGASGVTVPPGPTTA
jgi:uncharacterized protein